MVDVEIDIVMFFHLGLLMHVLIDGNGIVVMS